MKKWIFVSFFAVAFGFLATSSTAQANIRNPGGNRSVLVEPHIAFGYHGGGHGAAGVRVSIPIVQNGFVPRINNSVYISFGVDTYTNFKFDYFHLGIPVTLLWNFHFTRKFSAFFEAGLNVYLGSGVFGDGDFVFSPGQWFTTAIGVRYYFTRRMGIHARVGNPYSSVGLEFSI